MRGILASDQALRQGQLMACVRWQLLTVRCRFAAHKSSDQKWRLARFLSPYHVVLAVQTVLRRLGRSHSLCSPSTGQSEARLRLAFRTAVRCDFLSQLFDVRQQLDRGLARFLSPYHGDVAVKALRYSLRVAQLRSSTESASPSLDRSLAP